MERLHENLEFSPLFSKVDVLVFFVENGRVKRVLKWMLGAVLLLLPVGGAWWLWHTERQGILNIFMNHKAKPVPDLERYEFLGSELKRWRLDLVDRYRNARGAEQKLAVEHDARIILEMIMPEMMRCWLGTGYDFNGVAEKPGEGKIACGYFVSTVIRDAGFKVNRYKLAQQPSQNIIRTFVGEEYCHLHVGEKYDTYADRVEVMEPGIYLMGLDTHVGFVVHDGKGMNFLHSSGLHKTGVVEESREQARSIKASRWRMLGCFTADPDVIRMWLAGEKVVVAE